MHIKQYRPTYFEGFTNEEANFETLEELLKLQFVANFANKWFGAPNLRFHRYSIDRNYHETCGLLMAEYDGGYEWWVVGFLTPPSELTKLGLPEFVAKYRDK